MHFHQVQSGFYKVVLGFIGLAQEKQVSFSYCCFPLKLDIWTLELAINFGLHKLVSLEQSSRKAVIS